VVCGLLVIFEIGSMAKGMAVPPGSYSLGLDTLTSKPGSSCGLSDKVLVEAHPADGVLSPLPPVAPATLDPANAPITEGFVRNGVPPPGGGTGASGQDYTLTNGRGGDDAPVWGSYHPGGSPTGELRTAWFGLPLAARRGDVPLVISAAGRLRDGNSLTLQFGLPTSNGVQVIDPVRLDHRPRGEPTWRDLEVYLQLLPRSSTGERMNPYTSLWTGVAAGDGPQEFHLVLLDNGRTQVLADQAGRQTLNCIRCSACLNVCPVYERTGGHAYGSVYPGPIGAILSPMLTGVEDNASLPYASSLCGACYEACPVAIDIPSILVHLRGEHVGAPERTTPDAVAFRALSQVMARPRPWHVLHRVAAFTTCRDRCFWTPRRTCRLARSG